MPDRDIQILEGLVIRPGDTLIIRVDPDEYDDEATQAIQDALHFLLPDVRGLVLRLAGQVAVQRAPELDDPARPLVDIAPLPESVPFTYGVTE